MFKGKGADTMVMPMLDILKENNIYSGSEGPFRYKVKPNGETAKVWAYQTYCLEYCQENGLVLGESEFPLDEDGLAQMEEWLKAQAAKLAS